MRASLLGPRCTIKQQAGAGRACTRPNASKLSKDRLRPYIPKIPVHASQPRLLAGIIGQARHLRSRKVGYGGWRRGGGNSTSRLRSAASSGHREAHERRAPFLEITQRAACSCYLGVQIRRKTNFGTSRVAAQYSTWRHEDQGAASRQAAPGAGRAGVLPPKQPSRHFVGAASLRSCARPSQAAPRGACQPARRPGRPRRWRSRG
jgi:hypothetical protein